jgi:hypothetical protein
MTGGPQLGRSIVCRRIIGMELGAGREKQLESADWKWISQY